MERVLSPANMLSIPIQQQSTGEQSNPADYFLWIFHPAVQVKLLWLSHFKTEPQQPANRRTLQRHFQNRSSDDTRLTDQRFFSPRSAAAPGSRIPSCRFS